MLENRLILAIETSCDETAAAVYSPLKGILSNELFSQVKIHEKYGGVVPEMASRSHIEKINLIVQQALTKANVSLDDISAIAVTNKPGLPGSLLVGVCFAKALALAKNIPIMGINHLEGHAFSSFLDGQPPFPHLCITASGGHTSLYVIYSFGDYQVIGQTLDDAAGEAFDKIAKVLGLEYPGGPLIEKLAQQVNFEDFYSYPRGATSGLDFSFSGLKTAIIYDLARRELYDLKTRKLSDAMTAQEQARVASSLLVCMRDIFIKKISLARQQYPNIKALSFVGGVACNKFLKKALNEYCQQNKLSFFSPAPQFCTDNAAMIALVGNYKFQQGHIDTLMLDIF